MDAFEGIDRDSVRVDVTVFREEDRPSHVLPDGRSILGGESLAAFVRRIGGWSGQITDPWGGTHDVSVVALADADPERTFVQVGFRTKADRPARA